MVSVERRGRGRPKLVMTRRRRQMLVYLTERAMAGERVTLGRIVRECGFYQREDAKRVLRDLKAMGRTRNFCILPETFRLA